MTRHLSIAIAVVAAACSHPAPPAPLPPGNTAGDTAVASSGCAPTTPELAAAVARIDADADPLHSDYTPEVGRLIENGLPGACAVVDLLLADSRDTRMHAQRVMEGVLLGEYGWRGGRGYPSSYAQDQSTAVAQAMGYDWDAAPDALRTGAARWRAWLDGEHPGAVAPADGPAVAAMTAALDRIRPQLEQCGQPVDLTVTFQRAGTITSIWGTASTDASYRACLSAAAAAVTIPVYERYEDVWIRYPWN